MLPISKISGSRIKDGSIHLNLLGDTIIDSGNKILASLLPSYVDDVIEVADFASLPTTGETGKIYVTLDNGKTYRWGGTEYVEISATDIITLNTTATGDIEILKNGTVMGTISQNAGGINYNNTGSGATGGDVQAVIDEIFTILASAHPEADVATGSNPALTVDVATQEFNLDMSATGSYDNTASGLTADNVQGAIDEASAKSDTVADDLAQEILDRTQGDVDTLADANAYTDAEITALEAEVFKKDGSVPATDDFDLGANQIKNMADAVDPQDATTLSQVEAMIADATGSVSGTFPMDGTTDGVNKTFTITGEFVQGSVMVHVGRVVLEDGEFTLTYDANTDTTTVVIGANINAPDTDEDVLIFGIKPGMSNSGGGSGGGTAITLTTNGTTGAATLTGGVLNIPNYTAPAVNVSGGAVAQMAKNAGGTGVNQITDDAFAWVDAGVVKVGSFGTMPNFATSNTELDLSATHTVLDNVFATSTALYFIAQDTATSEWHLYKTTNMSTLTSVVNLTTTHTTHDTFKITANDYVNNKSYIVMSDGSSTNGEKVYELNGSNDAMTLKLTLAVGASNINGSWAYLSNISGTPYLTFVDSTSMTGNIINYNLSTGTSTNSGVSMFPFGVLKVGSDYFVAVNEPTAGLGYIKTDGTIEVLMDGAVMPSGFATLVALARGTKVIANNISYDNADKTFKNTPITYENSSSSLDAKSVLNFTENITQGLGGGALIAVKTIL